MSVDNLAPQEIKTRLAVICARSLNLTKLAAYDIHGLTVLGSSWLLHLDKPILESELRSQI